MGEAPDNRRLTELMYKMVAGTITEEEYRELKDFMDSTPEGWERLDSRVRRLVVEAGLSHLDSWEEAKSRSLQRTRLAIRREHSARVRKLTYLAAASVLLIFVSGALWYRNGHTFTKTSVNANAGADIRPATNKARLTLANGKVLYLDSTRNGNIATQGTVTITKAGGEIVYAAPDQSTQPQPGDNELHVPRAGKFELKLPDGTMVWLNSSTDISYPVAFGAERRVKIDGEAYFEVAKDPAKPFIVETERSMTRVLGTSFDVNAYAEDSMEMITVISGAVSVAASSTDLTLQPGEQAFEKEGVLSLQRPNLQAVTAWRRGFFYFQNADIRTIMRQISRFYDVSIQYDGQPSRETYDGLISRDLNLSQALSLLSKLNIKATLDGKVVTVSPEGKDPQ